MEQQGIPTLSHDEHMLVTEFIIKRANNRVPVMAGWVLIQLKNLLSSLNTLILVEQRNLLVTPYYNKPTEMGLYEHFKTIAENSPSLPVYLYNIPGRSILKLSTNLIKKLSNIKNIVGVKDATADLATPLDVSNLCGINLYSYLERTPLFDFSSKWWKWLYFSYC